MSKETSVTRKRALNFVVKLEPKIIIISNCRYGISKIQARSECITKLCALEIILD